MPAVHRGKLDAYQRRRRFVLGELLVFHQAFELFLPAVIEEEDIVWKTLFDRKNNRMKIQPDELQLAETTVEHGIRRDRVDDGIKRAPLARQLNPPAGNVVLLDHRGEQGVRLGGGNPEV